MRGRGLLITRFHPAFRWEGAVGPARLLQYLGQSMHVRGERGNIISHLQLSTVGFCLEPRDLPSTSLSRNIIDANHGQPTRELGRFLTPIRRIRLPRAWVTARGRREHGIHIASLVLLVHGSQSRFPHGSPYPNSVRGVNRKGLFTRKHESQLPNRTYMLNLFLKVCARNASKAMTLF